MDGELMIDWTKGYTVEARAVSIDPDTWSEGRSLDGVVSVSIDRSGDGDCPLIEGGTVEIDLDSAEDFKRGWYRIDALVTQGGDFERVDLATLWLEPDGATQQNGRVTLACTGSSVLKPAASRMLRKGAFAAAGVNGAETARKMLAECLDAPVSVTGSFKLAYDMVFDMGSSYLRAVWSLLDAGGFCIMVNGDGTVSIEPMPTEDAAQVGGKDAGLFLDTFKESASTADIPNVYHVIDGDESATARNDDPNSPTSTVNMFEVDVVDSSPQVLEGETLESYARRKLAEARVVSKTYSYTREFQPGIRIFDPIGVPRADILPKGSMRVMSQKLTIGNGIKVEEQSRSMEVV